MGVRWPRLHLTESLQDGVVREESWSGSARLRRCCLARRENCSWRGEGVVMIWVGHSMKSSIGASSERVGLKTGVKVLSREWLLKAGEAQAEAFR